MVLDRGTKLGPYEILEPLGAGGMGEVYCARDTRLGRTVAIKICAARFSERFEYEARAIAALNHPHVCTLYDVGPDYLVMELVEGPTLAARMKAGPISPDEALVIARQIAEALEAAHEKGIIHRDLKPANIKFTVEGKVKVLDFGLAKALGVDNAAADPRSSPTLTLSPTRVGVILGTAAYMSPEQARGAVVDKRSDIWAFGVVFYEMLTARPIFADETVSDTLAAVLKTDPDWSALPLNTAPSIRRLLRRCLERDRNKRLHDIADARLEIDEALTGSVDDTADQMVGRIEHPTRWRLTLLWLLALLGPVFAFVALWGWLRAPAPAPRPVMHWSSVLPNVRPAQVTLSPDGSHLAYVGNSSGSRVIYVRRMDELEAKPISSTEGSVGPFFSPDGRWLGYATKDKLKKVPVTGGSSLTICDLQGFAGASWGPDDTIIFGDRVNKGLSRVAAAGGQPHVLSVANPKKEEDFYAWPHFLPGGHAVLFSIRNERQSWDEARIAVLNLRTSEQRVLLDGGAGPHYVPTGHLMYARAGSLYAVPFDLRRFQLKGPPVPVLEDVSWFSTFGYAEYSFSASGTLVYCPRAVRDLNRTMVWVDREGAAVPLPAPPRAYANPSVSPDGQRIAVNIAGEGPESWGLWIYEQSRGTLTRLTSGLYNLAPVWTPDGKRVTFRSRSEAGKNISWTISWIRANGTGSPEVLLHSDLPAIPGSWSPDGRVLAFQQGIPGRTEFLLLPSPATAGGTDQKARPLIAAGQVWGPQISSDGRWIAYASGESVTRQVYVQPFPGLGEKWPISTDGGEWPRWARNGRELFYRNGDKMMAVDIAARPDFRAGKPRVLFEGHYETSADNALPTAGYDVSSDGKRFLMIKGGGEQAASVQLQVVQDWFEELKRRVPEGQRSGS